MDYGKFRFDQLKKEKEARKNQRVVEIKEIRMSPGIDTNDFNVKLRNALKFLREGNRVKVTVRFRGREISHAETSMNRIRDEILHGIVEGTVTKETRNQNGDTYTISCNPVKKK